MHRTASTTVCVAFGFETEVDSRLKHGRERCHSTSRDEGRSFGLLVSGGVNGSCPDHVVIGIFGRKMLISE